MSKSNAIKEGRWGTWEYMNHIERYEAYHNLKDKLRRRNMQIKDKNTKIEKLTKLAFNSKDITLAELDKALNR